MKRYDIYISGGERIMSVFSSCIEKACRSFIETLSKKAKYKIESREYASIAYEDNHSIMSDFVVQEA